MHLHNELYSYKLATYTFTYIVMYIGAQVNVLYAGNFIWCRYVLPLKNRISSIFDKFNFINELINIHSYKNLFHVQYGSYMTHILFSY